MTKRSKLNPSYNHAQKEKKKCIPGSSTRGELDGTTAANYNASVDLQELLNHAPKWIIESVGLQIRPKDLVMISKVGNDGCTGQSVYKQMVSDDNEPTSIAVEEYLFLFCMVPLEIWSKETNEVVWTNPP